MDFVYGIVGFVVLMGALSYFQARKRERQRIRDEMNTMTVKELIRKLKKCDPNERVIEDIRYADHDIKPLDLDDPQDPGNYLDSVV